MEGRKEIVAVLLLVAMVTCLGMMVFGGVGIGNIGVGAPVQVAQASSVLNWVRPNGGGGVGVERSWGQEGHKVGDVDRNGVVDRDDVMELGRMIGGQKAWGRRADVNGDGRGDCRDISAVEGIVKEAAWVKEAEAVEDAVVEEGEDNGVVDEGDGNGVGGDLQFAGYEWNTRSDGGDPGNNEWSSGGAWVDSVGHLHLKIGNVGGSWYCAEVETVEDLGFGTYTWTVSGADTLDKNVVLGLFNYADGGKEIDIEAARWGNDKWPNGNYTVWPEPREKTFELGAGSHTFQFTWSEDGVSFNTDGVQGWSVSGGVDWAPMPTFMNLWLYEGRAPSNGKETEVVVTGFKFEAGTGATDGEEGGVVADVVVVVVDAVVRGDGDVRALYVWDAYYGILTDGSEQDRFFRACANAGVNTVWMLTGNEKNNLDSLRFFADGGSLYERFIERANGLGIQVHALFGSAKGRDVLDDPETSTYKTYVMAILKYNYDHPGARFAGLHFDVENIGSGSYNSDDVFYQKYLEFVRDHLKKWNYQGQTVQSQGMMLSLYQDVWPGKHVSVGAWTALVKQFDLVCLQAYGDDLDSVVAKEFGCLSQGRAEMLQDEGIPFTILLETGHASSNVTFMDDGKGALEKVESGIDDYYSQYSEYAGIGLHNYSNSIRAWYSE